MLKNLLCILWSFVYYIPDNFLDVRVKQQYKLKFCQLFRKMMGENFCFGINMGLQNYIYWYLLFPRKSSFSGTILENYFGRRSPTHESELPMQLRYTGSCEPPGRVGGVQMHKPCRVQWRSAGNYHNIFSVFKEIHGLLRPFITIYLELKFIFNTYVYKSLIWAPKLHAPKLHKAMSKLLQDSAQYWTQIDNYASFVPGTQYQFILRI